MKSILSNLFVFIVLVGLVACSSFQSPKERYFFDTEYESDIDFICIPIQYNSQTYVLCAGKGYLYNLLNIKICSKVEFMKLCYQSLKKEEPIIVDSTTFYQMQNDLYNPNIPIPEAWKIYENTQMMCDTLHSLFLRKEWGDPRIKYLIYKCWERDIFVGTSDELGPYYLNIYDSKLQMRLY